MCRTISCIHTFPRITNRAFGFLLLGFKRHQTIGQITDAVAALFQPRLRFGHLDALFFDVRLDHAKLFANRTATRFCLRGRLGKL